jgi:DNA-binding NtrC family response regulator
MGDPGTSRQRVVLVVDDDDATCAALEQILRDEDYQVVTARRAADGLRVVKAGGVDIVVLDLIMPEMDGWGFVEALRQDPCMYATPVLVMTAHGEAVLATAPVAAGYFKKPLVLDKFLQVLSRTLSLRPPANDVGKAERTK